MSLRSLMFKKNIHEKPIDPYIYEGGKALDEARVIEIIPGYNEKFKKFSRKKLSDIKSYYHGIKQKAKTMKRISLKLKLRKPKLRFQEIIGVKLFKRIKKS